MNYIGIDPSTKTGICIMNEEGNIIDAFEIQSKVDSDPQRFMDIAMQVKDIVNESDKVCIEGFSYNSKGKGVSTQYGIGWAIRTALVELQEINYIPNYVDIPPSTLKKFATGKGNASKENMILPIFKRWGYENDSDNIRDAFILAMIGRALDGLGEPTKAQMDCIKGLK